VLDNDAEREALGRIPQEAGKMRVGDNSYKKTAQRDLYMKRKLVEQREDKKVAMSYVVNGKSDGRM